LSPAEVITDGSPPGPVLKMTQDWRIGDDYRAMVDTQKGNGRRARRADEPAVAGGPREKSARRR